MKRLLMFVILALAIALFAASCGGSSSTTTSGPATTVTTAPSAGSTTSSVTGTTSSTVAPGGSTTSSVAGQTGQYMVQLTGADMVPPVTTQNTAQLTLMLQGAALAYELDAMGLQPGDVTSAGIYVLTSAVTGSTAAGATTTTSATTGSSGAAGQQGTMVIDLLAGQTPTSTTAASGSTTTAAGSATTAAGSTGSTGAAGAPTVIAKGMLTQQNLVGDWAGRSINDLAGLLASLATGTKNVWVQIDTQQFPNGELRGYIDVAALIQQMLAGAGGTATSGLIPSTGAS